MLQAGRRRGWGGFYQARPSLAVAPTEARGEGEQRTGMDQKKTCRELLEERQMRRYWRAQRRAKKGGRSCADENWRKTEGTGSGRSWREEMNPRLAQQQAPKRTETAPMKRRNPIEKAVVENGKLHEEKRDAESGGFGGGGFNQAVFWKDPLPEISCKDLDLLSNDSKETSDEDLEEDIVKLRKPEEYRKVDKDDEENLEEEEEKEEEEEEVEEEEEEEERPVLFIKRETAVNVSCGIKHLEKETRSVVKEADKVGIRVRRLQERLARLEG